MSDHPKKEEKTLGQTLGSILVGVLLVSLFLMVIGPLLGIGFSGLTSSIAAIGQGSYNVSAVLNHAHMAVRTATQQLLMIIFSILMFVVFARFLVYIFGKIMDTMKGEDYH